MAIFAFYFIELVFLLVDKIIIKPYMLILLKCSNLHSYIISAIYISTSSLQSTYLHHLCNLHISFYYSVIRFQIFRVNRGTWLVNSRHVTQTQTSVYFSTDVLKWPCSTRASPPWRDDITEEITYVITRVSAKTYVCFLCEHTQAISVNPSSLKQCQKYTEPCHQLCHLCRFVSLGSFS